MMRFLEVTARRQTGVHTAPSKMLGKVLQIGAAYNNEYTVNLIIPGQGEFG
jgi:hypothetical protein